MRDYWIRQARPEDKDAITALNDTAFGSRDEGRIVTQLASDGDSLTSLVAHNDREIVGHIQFFRVLVDSADTGSGLGPMSVKPDFQRKGIGSGLVCLGLTLMEGQGREICFVLGHPDYYPKFGFNAGLAAPFGAPWSGPAFMARTTGTNPPAPGTLTYPKAFLPAP